MVATGEDYVLPGYPCASLSLGPLANAVARLRLPMAGLGWRRNPFTPVVSEAKLPSGIATIFVGWMSIRTSLIYS